jgi:brefeldin A-inhibited guanine nucleotide-exchange protein
MFNQVIGLLNLQPFLDFEVPPILQTLFKSQSFLIAIDKIFANTVNLSVTTIVNFVKALCEVGHEEIEEDNQGHHHGPPRTYCLAKLVETAYYNM